jgi:hypothetical protein
MNTPSCVSILCSGFCVEGSGAEDVADWGSFGDEVAGSVNVSVDPRCWRVVPAVDEYQEEWCSGPDECPDRLFEPLLDLRPSVRLTGLIAFLTTQL